MSSRNRVVLVGAGQVRRRPALDGPWDPVEPARLIADAVSAAVADCGVPELTETVDLLGFIPPIAWGYEDLPRRVAEFAALSGPRALVEVSPGGEASCTLVNATADRIRSGDARVAVVAGGETMYSTRRARREGLDLVEQGWPRYPGRRDFLRGQRDIVNDLERRHGLVAPTQCYPLLENAMRAVAGRSVAAHQRYLARMLAPHSKIAADNPIAWLPTAWTEQDLETVDEENRWICFPYPKRMNAVLEVDQAAALVLMSRDEAERRGIPEHLQVRFLGGASAADAWTVTERASLVSSAGYAAAAGTAIEHAGTRAAEISMFDLYSSFPCAIQLAMGALGLDLEDPRPRTVTGGLAYHGGPHQYSLHAVATMIQRLRSAPDRIGLVSGMGMTATKHAVSILGGARSGAGATGATSPDVVVPPAEVDGPPLRDTPEPGSATVESYTVEFDRSGAAVKTVFMLRCPDGARTLAQLPSGAESLDLAHEYVGTTGRLHPGSDGEPNRFQPL